jgi:hypothetical protein
MDMINLLHMPCESSLPRLLQRFAEQLNNHLSALVSAVQYLALFITIVCNLNVHAGVNL